MMNYDEALAWIHAGARFHRQRNGLDSVFELMQRLGQPQKAFASAHIAGTNGKGSICAMMDSVLREAGLSTMLFTSPFLERFNERIRLNGEPVFDEEIAELAEEVRSAGGDMPLAMFDAITAMGFLCAARHEVDAGVIEVGLGGWLDATNVLLPDVSVIAHIGLDHTEILGDTLDKIAGEKAGIIKENVPVVLYPHTEASVRAVFRAAAKEKNAKLYDLADGVIRITENSENGVTFDLTMPDGKEYRGLHTALLGEHQAYNAATAFAALTVLKDRGWRITEDQIRAGLAKAKWPARLERIGGDPAIILDGAHNPQGADSLLAALERYYPEKEKVLCCGAVKGKDAEGIASRFSKICASPVVTTVPGGGREIAADEIAALFPCADIVLDWEEAVIHTLERAKKCGGIAVFAGSLYLAGAVRRKLGEMGLIKN